MELPRARAFGSLRSRNVRLFLGGQSVSLVGTWVQQVAMGWLAYRLTGSPLLLGVLAAAGQLPSLLLMPIAGGLSDRWSRHRILVVTQSLAMALTLVLAGLALAGAVAVWHLVAIGALLGSSAPSTSRPARPSSPTSSRVGTTSGTRSPCTRRSRTRRG